MRIERRSEFVVLCFSVSILLLVSFRLLSLPAYLIYSSFLSLFLPLHPFCFSFQKYGLKVIAHHVNHYGLQLLLHAKDTRPSGLVSPTAGASARSQEAEDAEENDENTLRRVATPFLDLLLSLLDHDGDLSPQAEVARNIRIAAASSSSSASSSASSPLVDVDREGWEVVQTASKTLVKLLRFRPIEQHWLTPARWQTLAMTAHHIDLKTRKVGKMNSSEKRKAPEMRQAQR